MNAAILLLMAAAATAPEPEDIVVIARKFEQVTITLEQMSDGALRCKVERSSGDPEVDTLSCAAATTCAGRIQLSRANRKALADCGREERSRMIADLAAARQPKAP
jgi:hypothetical protein